MNKAFTLACLTASAVAFADMPSAIPVTSPVEYSHNMSVSEMYRHHEETKEFTSTGYLTKLQYSYTHPKGVNFEASYAKDPEHSRNDEFLMALLYAFPLKDKFSLLPSLSFESSSYEVEKKAYVEKRAFRLGMRANMEVFDKFHVGLKTELFKHTANSAHCDVKQFTFAQKRDKAFGYRLSLPASYTYSESLSFQASPFFSHAFDNSFEDYGVELGGNWTF